MKRNFKLSLIAVAMVAAMGTTTAQASEKFVTIGTGGQTGVYYVVGQSVCKLVNRNTAKTGIKCNAPSTGASVANLNAIAGNQMEMGIAQSDWQYHAYNGTNTFKGKKRGHFLAPGRIKADTAVCTDRLCEQGGFQDPLQIQHPIITGFPQKTGNPEGGPYPAFFVKHHGLIHTGVGGHERCAERCYQPVDLRSQVLFQDHCQRKGIDHISQSAQFYNQYTHPFTLSCLFL